MSVRYGIDLVLEPSFTAKVYQTRQIVCGQYASWAAEMQPLRMALTPYFPCPEEGLNILAGQVETIALDTREQTSYTLRRTGFSVVPSNTSVVMEFEAPSALFELQHKAMEAAQSHSAGLDSLTPFRPGIALLGNSGNLPEQVSDGRRAFR